MISYQLRQAVRRLLREPGFTMAAVLTLALGVGANIAVFAIVEAVLLRPLPYADADGLVILNHRDTRTGIQKEFIATADFLDMRKQQTAFEDLTSYGAGQSTIFGLDEPLPVDVLNAGPGLLEMLRVRAALGRGFERSDSREGAAPVAMLSYETWRDRFGSDPNIVGRSIKLGPLQRTIVGVAPKGFHFPANATTDVIIPMQIPESVPARRFGWIPAIARLKPGVTIEQGGANLAALARQFAADYPDVNTGITYLALPMRDALVGNTKKALVLLLAAVTFVLLIACANVANLLLARSLARKREMAVRVALGAGRGGLTRLVLFESLVLAGISSICATALAYVGARGLVHLIPESLNVPGLTDVHINRYVLAFALAITVVATLVFAAVSTFSIRLEHVGAELVTAATRASMSVGARRAAAALVVAEVAFAIVLLIGAGLILRSFAGLWSVDPGFRYENVLTLEIAIPGDRYAEPAARSAMYARMLEEVRAVPGVLDAGAAAVVPLTGNNWTLPLERPDKPLGPGQRPPDVGWQNASGGFFRALGIPVLAGRVFDTTDKPDGKPVVVVSEAIQRQYFDGESALGKPVRIGDTNFEIVGVVGSIRRADLRDDPRADMYMPFEMMPPPSTTLFVRTAAEPLGLANAVKRAVRNVESSTTFFETGTMAQIASESVRVTKLILWLLGVFAAMALTLAAVGSYGVMSYVVRQRTREIGTRMALGATRGSILWMVLKSGAAIAGLGTAIGLALGLAAARSLQSQLFGISAADPLTLAFASLVLTTTVLIACYLPARRAARVEPARTLAQQ